MTSRKETFRARQAAGIVAPNIPFVLTDVAELLMELGDLDDTGEPLLRAWDADNPKAVAAAIARFLRWATRDE